MILRESCYECLPEVTQLNQGLSMLRDFHMVSLVLISSEISIMRVK